MPDQYDRETLKKITTQFPKDKVVLFCLRICRELDAENTELKEKNIELTREVTRTKHVVKKENTAKLRRELQDLRNNIKEVNIKLSNEINKNTQLEANNNRLKTELSLCQKSGSDKPTQALQ